MHQLNDCVTCKTLSGVSRVRAMRIVVRSTVSLVVRLVVLVIYIDYILHYTLYYTPIALC